jgi:hypothetical protein
MQHLFKLFLKYF